MNSAVKPVKKKPRPAPKARFQWIPVVLTLLGLPLIGAASTYYFMDRFQQERDLRVRGESAHVIRISGGSLEVAHIDVDKTVREALEPVCPAGKGRCRTPEAAKVRYQNDLSYSVRLPSNLVLEPRPKQKRYVVKVARPVLNRPASFTAMLVGPRGNATTPKEYISVDATYQKLWSAIEQDSRAPSNQARVDAEAKAAVLAFIEKWRAKNWEMGPIESWPVEVIFE